ncbi:uncharacterized protein [Elaeis guineensis]|uniref:uncharacterized protein n=1 Tax=Elaeis guineensis var. tenera TaxID=51953 RepID=UPI003C6D6201
MASSSSSTLSATTFSNINVPVFEGENYEFWCVKMETLFLSLDVWEFIQTGYEELDSLDELTPTQREELKRKKIIDAGALGMLQRGVSPSIFPRIMRAKKAKEAWEILQQEFQGDKKVRAVKLQSMKRNFENLKMKKNETLNEYFTKFMELVNQMKSYGDSIDDRRIIEKILITLPEKFDPVVAVIEEAKDLFECSRVDGLVEIL